MGIVVRSAQLDTDSQLIIDFLARNHTSDSNQERFDWLYRRCPAGEARVWISTDSETQAIVGIAAAFPRRMYAFSEEKLGWVLGDFCIDPQYRSLGPALQLQRACLAEFDAGQLGIYYDFPSAAMVAVYRRLAVALHAPMVRMVKLLRADKKVERLIRQPQLARIVSSAINGGLARRDRSSRLRDSSPASAHQGACGNEFTQLAQSVRPMAGVCLERSGEYLNWRYLEHPYRRHEIVTLRESNCLLACAVIREEDQALDLVDLYGHQDAVIELGKEITVIAADRQLNAVTVEVLASHPWIKMFRRLGFYQRERFPVVARCSNGEVDDCSWSLMKGDRES
jgi:hypothetical protein